MRVDDRRGLGAAARRASPACWSMPARTSSPRVGDADALLAAVDRHQPDLVVRRRAHAADVHRRGRARRACRSATAGPTIGILVLSQYVEERYATELLAGDTACGRLPAEGPRRRRRASSSTRCAGSATAAPPSTPRWSRSCSPAPAGAIRSSGSRPRARGAVADGGGTVQRGHRAAAGRQRRRGREARQQHLHQARPAARARTTTAACSPCCGGWSHDDGRRSRAPVPRPAGLAHPRVDPRDRRRWCGAPSTR